MKDVLNIDYYKEIIEKENCLMINRHFADKKSESEKINDITFITRRFRKKLEKKSDFNERNVRLMKLVDNLPLELTPKYGLKKAASELYNKVTLPNIEEIYKRKDKVMHHVPQSVRNHIYMDAQLCHVKGR